MSDFYEELSKAIGKEAEQMCPDCQALVAKATKVAIVEMLSSVGINVVHGEVNVARKSR